MIGLALAGLAAAIALATAVPSGGDRPRVPGAEGVGAVEDERGPVPGVVAASGGIEAPQPLRPAPLVTGPRAPPTGDVAATAADEGREAPRPGSERAFHDQFVALGRASPDQLAARAREVLGPGGGGAVPEPAEVAMLRALWDTGSPDAAGWFQRVLRRPTLERPDGAVHVSPRDFAGLFLVERAGSDPLAADLLAGCVPDSSVEVGIRRRAAEVLARTGDRARLIRLAADLQGQDDPALLAGVAAALAANLEASGTEEFFPPAARPLPPNPQSGDDPP